MPLAVVHPCAFKVVYHGKVDSYTEHSPLRARSVRTYITHYLLLLFINKIQSKCNVTRAYQSAIDKIFNLHHSRQGCPRPSLCILHSKLDDNVFQLYFIFILLSLPFPGNRQSASTNYLYHADFFPDLFKHGSRQHRFVRTLSIHENSRACERRSSAHYSFDV